MPFQAGSDKHVTFQPAGLNQVTLNVTGWSWKEAVDKLDFTHTGTGGQQAVLPGILRGDGSVKMNFDSSNNPYASTPNILSGVKGRMDFYLGSAIPFRVPCMIVDVTSQSAVEGKVEWNCNVTLDYLTGVTMGTAYTRPT